MAGEGIFGVEMREPDGDVGGIGLGGEEQAGDGPRGKYPVDARTMLRPKAEGPLIGVQIQVALNNVRGVNYPYLYCVVLVKEDHKPPTPFQRKHKVVYEPGKGGGVRFLVVRQHADNSGGWHTGPTAISALVREAVSLANTVR